MGKRSGRGREESPTIRSRRGGAISGIDFVGLGGEGASGGFILGWIRFILDFPFEGRWSFCGHTKEKAWKDYEQDGWWSKVVTVWDAVWKNLMP